MDRNVYQSELDRVRFTEAGKSALTDALQEICAKMETDLAATPADATAAMNYCHDVLIPDMAKAREAADQLETLTASDYWPFPVYSDLLFYV